MTKFTFTADSFTCNGKTYPARYEAADGGAVFVYTAAEDAAGKEIRIRFDESHPDFKALQAVLSPAAPVEDPQPVESPAAEEERPAGIPEGYTATTTAAGNVITVQRNEYDEEQTAEDAPQPVEETAAPVEAPAADPQPVEAAQPRQIPEKTFIGESITGKGWKIFFDGHAARTRVIFENTPTDAARAAVEKAGFYFSAAMDSWNKKLTFKAYRAAQALAGELSALYA